MNDDKSSRHGMYAIIAFNLTIIFCMMVFAWLRGGMTYLHFFDFVGGFVLATAAAGGVFGAANVLDL